MLKKNAILKKKLKEFIYDSKPYKAISKTELARKLKIRYCDWKEIKKIQQVK